MINKKINLILPLVVSSILLTGCNPNTSQPNITIKDYVDNKAEGNKQFDYQGNYIAPELVVDGLDKDKQWENASEELVFGETKKAKMKIYRGEEALFCFFNIQDEDIETVGTNNGDDVTKGDSVEVYFDFKNDAADKPATDDIQINIGAHGKTRIFVGSNGQWGSWNGLLDYSVELNGTLNNDKDVDIGYTVELMIPYSQVGIDKNSKFGVTCGHVQRGKDSTNDTLPYTWGGIVFENNFVDPQSPKAYLICYGNTFYSRAKEPIGNVKIFGKVVDFNNSPIENAKVKVADKEVTTDSSGNYVIPQIDSLSVEKIEVSKENYLTYSYDIPYSSLNVATKEVNINACLLTDNEESEITLTGKVINPIDGFISGADISIGTISSTSNANGEFSIKVKPSYNLSLVANKTGYKESDTKVNLLSLVGKESHNLGNINLFSPSSYTEFAGTKGIDLVKTEIYRGFEGINFVFMTDHEVSNGSKIELFIDTKHSFNGRDYTDYRLDLSSDGAVFIENYGNGTNNVASTSGIIVDSYLKETTYYLEAMVPYSFLDITKDEVIGISLGMYDSKILDWDGWAFAQNGFDDYVAPEFSEKYCRIGVDNILYRATSNDVEINRILVKVVDDLNNPIPTAKVNGVLVNEDGNYRLAYLGSGDINLTIEANGYSKKVVNVKNTDFVDGKVSIVVSLTKGEAIIKGDCNVNGTKIYLESDPTIVTYVSNGTYEIKVPTNGNAKLIFERDGYVTKTITIGKNSLIQSSQSSTPIIKDVELVSI